MEIMLVECPKCKGKLQIDASKEKAFCIYCRAEVLIVSPKLEKAETAAVGFKSEARQKLEHMKTEAKKITEPGITLTERERELFALLQGIGFLSFFTGGKKVLPAIEQAQILERFQVPETEKALAYMPTNPFPNNKKGATGVVFGVHGIYVYNHIGALAFLRKRMLKLRHKMTYEELRVVDIRAKSKLIPFSDFLYLGNDILVDLGGNIHAPASVLLFEQLQQFFLE